MKTKLLVIEDELAIRKFLRASADDEIYDISEADSGTEGIRLTATFGPNVILLDLGLPDMPGEAVIKRIREWSEVPIIVISACGDDVRKVLVLDGGANDYITKPFSVPELFARIRAAIRTNSAPIKAATLTVQDLQIDFEQHCVRKGGTEVHLTPTEFRFLSLLAKNLGKLLTHRQILLTVWGPEYEFETHYLRVYAQQLRAKIEDDPSQPKLLITETGIGYRLRE